MRHQLEWISSKMESWTGRRRCYLHPHVVSNNPSGCRQIYLRSTRPLFYPGGSAKKAPIITARLGFVAGFSGFPGRNFQRDTALHGTADAWEKGEVVGAPGLEPGTSGLKGRCSTNWAIPPQGKTARTGRNAGGIIPEKIRMTSA